MCASCVRVRVSSEFRYLAGGLCALFIKRNKMDSLRWQLHCHKNLFLRALTHTHHNIYDVHTFSDEAISNSKIVAMEL